MSQQFHSIFSFIQRHIHIRSMKEGEGAIISEFYHRLDPTDNYETLFNLRVSCENHVGIQYACQKERHNQNLTLKFGEVWARWIIFDTLKEWHQPGKVRLRKHWVHIYDHRVNRASQTWIIKKRTSRAPISDSSNWSQVVLKSNSLEIPESAEQQSGHVFLLAVYLY